MYRKKFKVLQLIFPSTARFFERLAKNKSSKRNEISLKGRGEIK